MKMKKLTVTGCLFYFYVSVIYADDLKQISNAPDSPVINTKSGNVSIHYDAKSKIPVCDGYFPDITDESSEIYKSLQSINKNPEKEVGYIDGEKFNKCILDNEGRIIKLSVWLGDKQVDDAATYLKNNGQIYFHISDSFTYSEYLKEITGNNGAEYLLEINKDSDAYFSPISSSRTNITGLFKVSKISGPYQGSMSVLLKGVKIEDAK